MARRLDDPSAFPLTPIDDGMTDDERTKAWAEWDAEWDDAPVLEIAVSAAETLAKARAAGEV
jgi:hypothetical protein